MENGKNIKGALPLDKKILGEEYKEITQGFLTLLYR